MTHRRYDIEDWVFDFSRPAAVSTRPGLHTLSRRLFFLLLMVGLSVFLYRSASATRAESVYPLWWCAVFLLGGSVLYVAMAVWERLSIWCDGRWLHVRSVALWPSERRYAVAALRGVSVVEQEVRSSTKSGRRFLGVRWRVLLQADSDLLDFVCGSCGAYQPATCPEQVHDFAQRIREIAGMGG